MYCPECKVNYRGEFKYCVTCNEELMAGRICAHCETVNSESARICNLCGEFIEEDVRKKVASGRETLEKTFKECVRCHSQFPVGKIYCDECGSDLVLKTGIFGEVNYEKASMFGKLLSFVLPARR